MASPAREPLATEWRAPLVVVGACVVIAAVVAPTRAPGAPPIRRVVGELAGQCATRGQRPAGVPGTAFFLGSWADTLREQNRLLRVLESSKAEQDLRNDFDRVDRAVQASAARNQISSDYLLRGADYITGPFGPRGQTERVKITPIMGSCEVTGAPVRYGVVTVSGSPERLAKILESTHQLNREGFGPRIFQLMVEPRAVTHVPADAYGNLIDEWLRPWRAHFIFRDRPADVFTTPYPILPTGEYHRLAMNMGKLPSGYDNPLAGRSEHRTNGLFRLSLMLSTEQREALVEDAIAITSRVEDGMLENITVELVHSRHGSPSYHIFHEGPVFGLRDLDQQRRVLALPMTGDPRVDVTRPVAQEQFLRRELSLLPLRHPRQSERGGALSSQ